MRRWSSVNRLHITIVHQYCEPSFSSRGIHVSWLTSHGVDMKIYLYKTKSIRVWQLSICSLIVEVVTEILVEPWAVIRCPDSAIRSIRIAVLIGGVTTRTISTLLSSYLLHATNAQSNILCGRCPLTIGFRLLAHCQDVLRKTSPITSTISTVTRTLRMQQVHVAL